MYSILAGVALSVAAPVPPPPPNVTPAPTGPAPVLLFLKADANGKVMVQVAREEKVEVAQPIAPAQPGAAGRAVIIRNLRRHETVELGQVKDLTITTVDGRKVSVEEAAKRLEKGETVLIAPAGQPISPAYLKVFKDDTLILSSPELIGAGGTTIPNRIQPRPVQIQPAVPPAVLPAQPGGVIQIQIGPAVEAIPLPAAPVVPVEKLKKALPADQADREQLRKALEKLIKERADQVDSDRKAVPPLPPAKPTEKESSRPEKQDK